MGAGGREKSFFMSQMSHESNYESVSGFSPKVRIRVRFRVGVTGYQCLNILTHDSFEF